MYTREILAWLGATVLSACSAAAPSARPRPALPAELRALGMPLEPGEIAAWDIDVRPDGTGLPPGRGSVADGAQLYAAQCASCHGRRGEGTKVQGAFLPNPALKGGQGSLSSARPQRTVGSFWPYAPTLYDYVYRAMPLGNAQSLSPDETYAVVAFVLHLNGIVEADAVMDAPALTAVRMPNRDGFFRPDE